MEIREPPVAPGDVRTVSIETTGDEGDGIARVERGYVLLVPDGCPGEEVKVIVEDVYRRFAFANVVSRTDTSPQRQSTDDEAQADLHAGATSKYDVEATHDA